MQADIFRQSGYLTFPAMFDSSHLHIIDAALNGMENGVAGARQMLRFDWCAQLANEIRDTLISARLVQPDFVCFQCTYFEKSVAHNWLVALHQDLSIPVRNRIDNAALSGWSEKDGAIFVQPPSTVLENLVALRFHIDECGAEDGALKLVPGSHRLGRISDADKARLRDKLGEVVCTVEKGGGMAMSPLLLHASSKATGGSRRRVLHFLFGPPALPYGLEWPVAPPAAALR
ncbi:phytanoyl-CoA dioxygenase family protein [Duganella hordei]|uniref:phytanoyl-CoA dioxygenase family protein n=1 Tax=Duganella hordei TaxID=2865934 RepID=UPI0030EA9CCF